MTRVVIVGAGIGGLVTAGLLARAGLDVTVLEAHIYPGGCAGTFYHQGYQFDAGATLAAGFEPGGAMQRLGQRLGIDWPAEPASEAMVVHLPDGSPITRWSDPQCWLEERCAAFGLAAEPFWRWQEQTADLLWQVVQQGLPWPPVTAGDLAALARAGRHTAGASPARLPGLLADATRPLSTHLPSHAGSALRLFADAQLLISAQATSSQANALYGAAALDLPRRGVVHLRGGMGALGRLLAEAVRVHGGHVFYRQRVTRVTHDGKRPQVLTTDKGQEFPADLVIFNLPRWDAAALVEPACPVSASQHAGGVPADGWGAYILYAGVDEALVPLDYPLHHQVVMREPLGEGNCIFLTLSLPGDNGRAPEGRRAVTISAHTALRPWWDLFERDRAAYEARKEAWLERIWPAAERALPGIRSATSLALPGTPVTFQRFTHRSLGWVGGFPQTSLRRASSPRLSPGLWLVGDSIFPGQSTLAVALGGMRVADAVLKTVASPAVLHHAMSHALLKGLSPCTK